MYIFIFQPTSRYINPQFLSKILWKICYLQISQLFKILYILIFTITLIYFSILVKKYLKGQLFYRWAYSQVSTGTVFFKKYCHIYSWISPYVDKMNLILYVYLELIHKYIESREWGLCLFCAIFSQFLVHFQIVFCLKNYPMNMTHINKGSRPFTPLSSIWDRVFSLLENCQSHISSL